MFHWVGGNAGDHVGPDNARPLGSPYGSKCADIHPHSKTLYMHNCHDGPNQKFYWDTE